MQLNSIKRRTWVKYKGEPWYVTMFHGSNIELFDAYNRDIAFAYELELEVLDHVQRFDVGDVVICTDKKSPLYQKIATVTDHIPESYDEYQIHTVDEKVVRESWVTPFQITSISY